MAEESRGKVRNWRGNGDEGDRIIAQTAGRKKKSEAGMPQYIFYKNIFVCPGFAKFTSPMFLKKYHNSTMSMNPVVMKKKKFFASFAVSVFVETVFQNRKFWKN